LYDARTAGIALIVDSERLPVVLQSFPKSNFMTVTDMSIQQVDLDKDLAQGFYYGDDYVVRLDLYVEVLYLRQWTKPYMPPGVRVALGLPEAEPQPEGEDDGG
jgi:hypothetical protein